VDPDDERDVACVRRQIEIKPLPLVAAGHIRQVAQLSHSGGQRDLSGFRLRQRIGREHHSAAQHQTHGRNS
jgi:hypothetical protein